MHTFNHELVNDFLLRESLKKSTKKNKNKINNSWGNKSVSRVWKKKKEKVSCVFSLDEIVTKKFTFFS